MPEWESEIITACHGLSTLCVPGTMLNAWQAASCLVFVTVYGAIISLLLQMKKLRPNKETFYGDKNQYTDKNQYSHGCYTDVYIWSC